MLVLISLIATSCAMSVEKRAVCEDKILHCSRILAEDPSACDPNSSWFKYTESNCMATCGSCSFNDQGGCEDDLQEDDCLYLRSLGGCEPVSYLAKYTIHNCKRTCGECPFNGDTLACSDLIGSDNCQQFISSHGSCEALGIGAYVADNCRKACGYCANDDDLCVDTLSSDRYQDPKTNCGHFKHYCNLDSAAPFIKDFMKQCPRTCGKC